MTNTNEMRDLFIRHSATALRRHEDRIGLCLGQLSHDQIWWREAETQNAVGNLVLHLCGNVRQWIISGVGGAADIREREAEFAARDDATPEELKHALHGVVEEAATIIEKITPERLAEPRTLQGYNTTVLEAVYQVVEHFSHHAGQILYVTKLVTSKDLGFYRHLSGQPRA
jgi:uncharacterized damage-inducible protein DinB